MFDKSSHLEQNVLMNIDPKEQNVLMNINPKEQNLQACHKCMFYVFFDVFLIF